MLSTQSSMAKVEQVSANGQEHFFKPTLLQHMMLHLQNILQLHFSFLLAEHSIAAAAEAAAGMASAKHSKVGMSASS